MPTLTTLYDFNGTDGASPSGLIADAQGNLFGTTSSGGAYQYGTVFELENTGAGYTYTVLYEFNGTDGAYPNGGLIADAQGNLFGTAYDTVFELENTGAGYTYTVLYEYNDPYNDPYGYAGPYGGLIADAQGNLFGTTYFTVFELENTGAGYTYTVLYEYNGPYGAYNNGGLIADAQGNLFGTTSWTSYYGNTGDGTLFELENTGAGYTYTVLYDFGAIDPNGGLLADAQGNLFGTTYNGGAYGWGTVFELENTGAGYTYTVLYEFNGTDGAEPYGLIADAQGNLFGATVWSGNDNDHGSVYELVNTTGLHGEVFELENTGTGYTFTVLYEFNGTDGAGPGGLIADAQGNLFGTTWHGGDNDYGTVFELDIDAPTITSNGGGDTASVNVAENTTAVTTVTATDPDAGQTLAFSIVPVASGGAVAGDGRCARVRIPGRLHEGRPKVGRRIERTVTACDESRDDC